MMNLNTIETTQASDANLVAESLLGNKEAFSAIVTRYQTLICSLAYSGIGNLSRSEHLAQEFPSRESLPPEQVITKKERSILWRSLERIPDVYREPLMFLQN
ncbi:MAG TPA: hypothetical protein VHX86_12340 [Tepidisphaeraceae bacterium]|jgi:hypothetical protein|nr:hypothetical protein [Tepidisphaeraceae bacterium]